MLWAEISPKPTSGQRRLESPWGVTSGLSDPGTIPKSKTLHDAKEGITRLESGILFIHNPEHFLSGKEEQQLCGLLAQEAERE